jgi:excisionase family DNA binding protein
MSTNDRSSEQLEFDFNRPPQPEARHEPLLTIAEACRIFNRKQHVFRRAIKAKLIPSYQLGSRRILLRASDITAAIEASRSGGAK